MATEQHRVVIGIDYVGDRDVQRYLSALQRIGALTEQQVQRLNALRSSAGPSGLAGALGASASGLRDYDSRANAALASTAAMRRETEGFQRALRELQNTMRGGLFDENRLRQQLFMLLQANETLKQIADNGNRFRANQVNLPGSNMAAIPAYQMSALTSGAYVPPSRALTKASAGPTTDALAIDFQRAEQRLIQATGQLARARTRQADDLIELIKRQQAYNAIFRGQEQLALPGRGPQPRTSDFGIPGASRFISRDRALELQQDQFLRALRDRVVAERQAALAAERMSFEERRAEGFFRRIAALEARGGILDIEPAGNVGVSWESRTQRSPIPGLQREIRMLEAEFARLTTAAKDNTREFNEWVATRNRQRLLDMSAAAQSELQGAKGAGADPRMSYIVAGDLAALASQMDVSQITKAPHEVQRFLKEGYLTKGALERMAPESRAYVTGDSEFLFGRPRKGAYVPGTEGRTDGESQRAFADAMRQGIGPEIDRLIGMMRQSPFMAPAGPQRLALPAEASVASTGLFWRAKNDRRGYNQEYARLLAAEAAMGSRGAFPYSVSPQGIASAGRAPLALGSTLSPAQQEFNARMGREQARAFAEEMGRTPPPPRPPGGGGGSGGGGFFGGGDTYGDDEYDRIRREFEQQRAQAASDLEKARANAAKADATARTVRERANIPLGEKVGDLRGFASEDDRIRAVAGSVAGLNAANERLRKAEEAHARAQEQATQSAQRLHGAQTRAATAAAGGGGAFGGAGGAGGGGFGGGRPTGPGGGFWSDFRYGFHGRQDKGYAEQLGQTFKFSLFYGTAYNLLFAFTQTMMATLQEGIQFQQAMTNLKIAADRSEEELSNIATELGQSSTRAGFAPSQGLEIGARSLGLYGVTDADRATQDQVMRISSRVVNQLAVGAKKAPVELQGDIAAISQALGLGAEGQFRIADLDAYMTKRFGIQQGSTLETVAQSGSVGKAAGFTDEELFAIAADMISRTGQTPSAVAGFMAQIFSRGGEGSLVDVARRQGIDPDQELQGIIRELAGLYKEAAPREQAEISAAFGRGKIQNAAVALLGDYDEVIARSTEAAGGGAVGAADRQFEERMRNLGGQIAQLGGVMKDFASQLAQSGLLDILGLGIITFREFLEVVNGVLRLWNEMPDGMQQFLIALGAATLLLRSQAGSNLASAAASGLMMRGAGGNAMALEGKGLVGGLALAGRGLFGMLGPIGLATTALMSIGAVKNSFDRMGSAADAADAVLTTGVPGPDASSSSLRAYQSNLRSVAQQNRDATGWFTNAITFGQANDGNMATAERLEAEARRIGRLARQRAAEESQYEAPTAAIFKSTAAEDLQAGIDALEQGGATAGEQLRALRDVLFGTARAASAVSEEFTSRAFARDNASGFVSAAAQGLRGLEGQIVSRVATPDAPGMFTDQVTNIRGRDLRRPLLEAFTSRQAELRLGYALDKTGVESLADLDEGTATQIAEMIAPGIAKDTLARYGIDDPKRAQKLAEAWGLDEKVKNSLRDYLLGQAADTQSLVTGDTPLSATDAKVATDLIVSRSGERLDALPQTDLRGRRVEAQRKIQLLRRTARRTDGAPLGITLQRIDEAQREFAQARFEELEAMRKTAQQGAKSKEEIQNIGRRFLNRAIRMAVRNRSGDVLAQIIGNAGRASIAMAEQAINEAIKTANAAIAMANQMANAAGYLEGQAASFIGNQIAQAEAMGMDVPKWMRDYQGGDKDVRKLRGMRRVVRQTQYDPDNTSVKGLDSGNPNLDDWYGTDAAKAEEDKDSPLEIAAARAAAYANRSEGQVAAARAAIMSAKASLAEAEKNTVAYWSAMGELFSAQNALVDALQAYRKNRMILNSDVTNPLSQARIESRAAAIKLREDIRSGAAPDVVAQDRVDLRMARANQESTAFSQRLQAVQTAEELGRISHTKYINYLENEKRRLERVKNRTFQQQQQLDQVDRLLQDAAKQMQGQFNLGDIRLPTPYQVRRYVEQASGANVQRMTAAANASSTTNVTLYVDGADTAKVTRIVQDVVGKPARTRTAAPRRR